MRLTAAVLASLLLAQPLLAETPPGTLDQKIVERCESVFQAGGDQSAEINAVTANDINALAVNRDLIVKHNKLFNFRLKDAGITNQQGTGRCWLFSGLNILSPSVMTKLHLKSFEFSQPYLTFWDKMEKANLFLEQMIEMRKLPLDDRKLTVLMSNPFGDGGWWHYVTALMAKYGAVPLSAMPETKQSINTGTINMLADRKLKAFASELRSDAARGRSVEQLRERKNGMLTEIYKLLVYAYGQPPTEFTFRYESKDSTVSTARTFTPIAFYNEFVADQVPQYALVMNNPTKEYDKTYQVESSRNMHEQADAIMLNIPIERLKGYALKALFDSQVVWFACDVGKDHLKDSAILANGVLAYDKVFGMSFSLTKSQQIELRESTPNHAMVFLGVDTTEGGKPDKWLVENSWGSARGDKGYWYMYDDWFEKNVYILMVDRRYLSDADKKLLDLKPVPLPVWDPFYSMLRSF